LKVDQTVVLIYLAQVALEPVENEYPNLYIRGIIIIYLRVY